jgi:hypothetical protein
MPFPDDWYYVYEDLVLYEAYKYADDPRAGDARVQGEEEPTMTGQLGTAYNGIREMRLREPQLQTKVFQSSKEKK